MIDRPARPFQQGGQTAIAIGRILSIEVFGKSVRPWLAAAPRPTLELITEDLRTPDEIERDLMRRAEALTPDLFAIPLAPVLTTDDAPVVSPLVKTVSSELLDSCVGTLLASENDEDEDTELVSPHPPLTKLVAYLTLVTAAQERAATAYASPVSALSESITMNLAKLDARRAGLLAEEIEAALKIGAYRGQTMLPATQPDMQTAKETTPKSAIPILWTSAAEMVKRRPDLAPRIETLRDDEVEALAALVGEALEEFYWIQLNVVLSLYLDHDLHLTRTVRKLPKSAISAS